MKIVLGFILLFSQGLYAQKLKNGSYLFKYCDLEYNQCISSCRVIIKKNTITVIATQKLSKDITGTKAGDILEKGHLVKNKKGKWTLKQYKNGEEVFYIDFKKRECWRF